MTFVEYVLEENLSNEEAQEEIDDWISEWHNLPGDMTACEVYEYLGMSREEYGSWVEDNFSLNDILDLAREEYE